MADGCPPSQETDRTEDEPSCVPLIIGGLLATSEHNKGERIERLVQIRGGAGRCGAADWQVKLRCIVLGILVAVKKPVDGCVMARTVRFKCSPPLATLGDELCRRKLRNNAETPWSG